MDRNARIAALSDREALLVLGLVSAELAAADTPATERDQAAVLRRLFAEAGEEAEVDVPGAAPQAAAIARDLLRVLGEIAGARPLLDRWLAAPPVQETAGAEVLLAAPLVFTACLVILQVAAQTRVRRDREGRWELDYDPGRKTALGGTMKELVAVLGRIVQKGPPGA